MSYIKELLSSWKMFFLSWFFYLSLMMGTVSTSRTRSDGQNLIVFLFIKTADETSPEISPYLLNARSCGRDARRRWLSELGGRQ